MKRSTIFILTAILTVLLVLALASCAQNSSTIGAEESETSADVSEASQTAGNDCLYPNGSPDPIGQSIAETYTITYEEVMNWYCDGTTYDDIMIALETSTAVDVSVDDLLAMLEEKTWEEIWVDTGFSSNP